MKLLAVIFCLRTMKMRTSNWWTEKWTWTSILSKMKMIRARWSWEMLVKQWKQLFKLKSNNAHLVKVWMYFSMILTLNAITTIISAWSAHRITSHRYLRIYHIMFHQSVVFAKVKFLCSSSFSYWQKLNIRNTWSRLLKSNCIRKKR